ncbi:MAG: A/G-specific adenine glycosylase [Gammaproteobacteria bacterium]|nr:A/G-specific adenine glycosylase [Gammaproteobacteria bacterium]
MNRSPPPPDRSSQLSKPLLDWHREHGRSDLPWQHPRTAYRVWVSEIMLQQTQVATVIPYFERFIAAFPDCLALAKAPLDTVLHHWTGLGYYARARNLHRTATLVRDQHGGELPRDFDALLALPGIGRSTAGAILAQAHGLRYPILDGNAKRVLARYYAIEGWPGRRAVENALWEAAEINTPEQRVADYTQAIMDLGATLCSRSRPGCERCPLASGCAAFAGGRQADYPGRKPRRALPTRDTVFVMVRDPAGALLLERRPPAGIWGGLWSFPEIAPGEDAAAWCRQRLQAACASLDERPSIQHTFTHYRLQITPLLLELAETPALVMDADELCWVSHAAPRLGLATPVQRLLRELFDQA